MRFDDVVVGHIDWIARQAFAFCRRKDDADDLAQEALLRILANRDKYDPQRDFRPWALTIITNIYKTWMSRRKRTILVSMEREQYDVEYGINADQYARIRDAMQALKDASQICIGVDSVLLYAKGYSYDEISAITGVTVGTVKSRIAAGRRAIRSLLN